MCFPQARGRVNLQAEPLALPPNLAHIFSIHSRPPIPTKVTVPVSDEADVHASRMLALRCAQALGFSAAAAQEVAIIASELAWNIVQHVGEGTLHLIPVGNEQTGIGLELHAQDAGPPIPDLAEAARDGHDVTGKLDPSKLTKKRGIGCGLGAIERLSDDFHQELLTRGKRIVAVRYRIRPPHRIASTLGSLNR